MYFQEYFSLDTSKALSFEPLDEWLAHTAWPVQGWEVTAADALGQHVTAFRTIFALILSMLAGFMHRMIPTPTGRHIYATLSGSALLYYAYGNQIFILLVLCGLMYLLMAIAPKKAGVLSWAICMPYLVTWLEKSGSKWDTGEVDATAALMVLVLKLIAICHNREDGANLAKRTESMAAEDKAMLITTSPPLLNFASYLFASGNLLAGPFFEYNDYISFTNRTGHWKSAFTRGMYMPALISMFWCIVIAIGSVAVHLVLSEKFPASALTGESVWKMSLAWRVVHAFLTAIAVRSKFYFVWSMSEASLNIAGFGFNGFSDAEKTQPKFDKYMNTDIFQVEAITSMSLMPKYWNVNTGVFLRRYCYERMGSGFLSMAYTQTISSMWHGLREGFLAFFSGTIFMFQSSKVIYRNEKRLPQGLVNSYAWTFFKWFSSHLQLSVFSIPFSLLQWGKFIESWQAFYFIPHIFSVGVCLFGALFPVKKSRTKKNEVPASNGSTDKPEDAEPEEKKEL